MKKLYEEPELEVVKFNLNYTLLIGSQVIDNPEQEATGDPGVDPGEIPEEW